jgi:DNA (cytosine-5)-methyltransferase 1
LENLGYQVAPFIIPASAVNAPHQRERVWFVAYNSTRRIEEMCQWSGNKNKPVNASNSDKERLQQCENRGKMDSRQTEICGQRSQFANGIETNGKVWDASNTNSRRLERSVEVGRNSIDVKWQSEFGNASNSDSNGFNECDSEHEKHSGKTGFDAFNDLNQNDERWDVANSDKERLQCARESTELGGIRLSQCDTQNYKSNWQNFPTQSPVCSGDDGLPTELDGITFSKWRNECIKAYGNAIVPQVVYQIFKAIEQYESKR